MSIRIDGTAQALAGEVLTYAITLRNVGSTPLTEVRLEQRIPQGVTVAKVVPQASQTGNVLVWNVGTIQPQAEKLLHLEIQPGPLEEFGLDPVASYKVTSPLKTKVTQPPFLVVVQGPETVVRGNKAIIQMTVRNHGATPLHSIRMQALLSPGLKHGMGPKVEAALEILKPGEQRTLPLEFLAIQEGPQSIAVMASSQEGPITRSKFTILVKENGLSARTTSEPVAGSNDTEIRVEITNTTGSTVRNPRLLIQYPERFEVHKVSHEGKLDLPNRLLHWSGLVDIAPGQTLTVLAHVQPDYPGDWPFQIVVTGDGIPENRTNHTIRMVSTQASNDGRPDAGRNR